MVGKRQTKHVTVTIPEELYLMAERMRAVHGMSRAAFYAEALRVLLERIDEDGRVQRDGLSASVESLAEMVELGFRNVEGELGLLRGSADGDGASAVNAERALTGEDVRRQADRLAGLLMNNWRATEMVYALLKAQYAGEEVSDREAEHRAGRAIGTKLDRKKGGADV